MTKQVRPIEIEDKENCNGWVACKSEYLEGVSPQNIHVLEAGLYQDKDGNWYANANEQRKTCCGKNKLKQGSWKFVEHSQDAGEMRKKLADLQNAGSEVCGHCVAHFYADQD